MARAKADTTGTQAAATAAGVSRRTIQRERKRLLEQSGAMVERSKPLQLTLSGIEAPPIEWPDELPPDPLAAHGRAGAVEVAVHLRLRQALELGDAAATKLFTSAWADVWKVLSRIEPLASQRVGQLRERLEERLEISRNYDAILATHGAAYIRSKMATPSETAACTSPADDDEVARWNEHVAGLEKGQIIAPLSKIKAEESRTPGPIEKELLAQAQNREEP